MSFTRRGFIIIGAGASLSACSSLGLGPSSVVTGTQTTPLQLNDATILAAVNAARRQNGNHPPFGYNHQLEAAARSQAHLMATKDQLAHDLGVKLRDRVDAAGYHGAVGENIAGGQATLEQALDGWLNSAGHRATLLSEKFVEFGLAVERTDPAQHSRYGIYWCMIAGGPFAPWLTSREAQPGVD